VWLTININDKGNEWLKKMYGCGENDEPDYETVKSGGVVQALFFDATRPRRGAVGDAPRVFRAIRVWGFSKKGSCCNKPLFVLWGAVLGVDKRCSEACNFFSWSTAFVFHLQLLCGVARERRDVRRRIPLPRTAEGERANL
jgi:hypothetical protein